VRMNELIPPIFGGFHRFFDDLICAKLSLFKDVAVGDGCSGPGLGTL
jgi:hypothetical protein